MAEIYQIWSREIGKKDKTVDLSAEISKAAMAGNDFLCEQTMNIFIRAYGPRRGNLALKLLPFGGLYLAGGVAPKILPRSSGGLYEGLLQKGRMRQVLEKIPCARYLESECGAHGGSPARG